MRRLNLPYLGILSVNLTWLALVFDAPQAKADVIYQAFNEHFVDIETKLDELAAIGYSHIQVSPPQKSVNFSQWWGRYQPVDLRVIDSPLGNEEDLLHLIEASHARGVKVIVDVVFNHMANANLAGFPNLDFPQFSARDFHVAAERSCIRDFNSRYQVTSLWLCSGSGDSGLPDLDTGSAYVRNEQKKYLAKLLSLGADGFRFDAAKHIEPDYFADILESVPKNIYSYGEVIANSIEEAALYSPHMPVTDFNLVSTMISAFSPRGDLRSLLYPVGSQGELPGSSKVVFARNHDTAMDSDFYNFGDLRDSLLASAYVLARGVGTGFVYRDDYKEPIVETAVRFHNKFSGTGVYVRNADEVCPSRCDARTMLFIERNRSGLVILNSANNSVDVPLAYMPGLDPGCYIDMETKLKVEIGRGSNGVISVLEWGAGQPQLRGGFVVGPRSAAFLVKSALISCK